MRRLREGKLERELAAYADGSLDPGRRARVERAVSESPELQADVAAQRRALEAVAEVQQERAPAALRARIELARRPERRPTLSGRAGLAVAGLGSAAMALAVALVILIGGGGGSALTVAQASALAGRSPQQAVPVVASGSATVPGVFAAGLAYPAWSGSFGYQATGVRRDRVSGRLATTLYYQRSGTELAYTIVSGRPVPLGERASATTRDGVALRWLTGNGRRPVVTWVRAGHTCVLSGSGVSVPALLELASWRDGGEDLY